MRATDRRLSVVSATSCTRRHLSRDREEVCPIILPSEQAAAGSGLLSELQLSLRTECAYQPSDQARDREAQSGSAVPPLITQRTECASQPQRPSQQALRAFASSREALLSVRAPLPTSPFSPPPFCTIVAIHHHQCQNTMGSRCQSSWSGYLEPRSP
jgi:hypothetical protein